MRFYYILLLFFITFLISCKEKDNQLELNDSVTYYITKSDKEENSNFLYKADSLNSKIINDSIRNRNLLKIAYKAFKFKDSLLFKKENSKAYFLSIKIGDTFGIADTHWNLGAYYGDQEVLDSSYYHYFQAYKLYEFINHKNYSAKMLYNLAFIQSRTSDYAEAEAKLFEAISKYKTINKQVGLFKCYSLLGSIYNDLRDFENSIAYHLKAKETLNKINQDKGLRAKNFNNLGITYQLLEDYEKSKNFFYKVLTKDSPKIIKPNLYAKVLDNLAYTKLLSGDTLGIKDQFNESLNIRQAENNFSGIVINKLHLSEYYFITHDTIKAILNAKEAYKLAQKVNNNRDILSSLKLLARVEKDSSDIYLKKYVDLSEEIRRSEQMLNNKFARIRFETSEYIEKAERLKLQKNLLYIILLAVGFIFTLLYFLKIQKSKNKELAFQNQQQLANEEIYRLLFVQQLKQEEGKLKERYRISEELHDGILGKIFGIRIGLGFLEIKSKDDIHLRFEKYLDDLQKIEEEIREVSHEFKNDALTTDNNYFSIVKDLIDENSKHGNFKYEFVNLDSMFWEEASEIVKVNIYRVIQELLQNIIKHSNAGFVSFIFKMENGFLVLIATDDGDGFDVTKKKKGIGMKNIRSRVEKLDGIVNFYSDIGKGTKITIKIPLK